MSLGMRWMTWSSDDDETALWNFWRFWPFHTDEKEVKEIQLFGIQWVQVFEGKNLWYVPPTYLLH